MQSITHKDKTLSFKVLDKMVYKNNFNQELRGTIGGFKPLGGYTIGKINVRDCNFFPSKKYVAYVREGLYDESLEYWKKRLKTDRKITPIVVEPSDFKTESGKAWCIRDGIHRMSASEYLGIKTLPAIICDTSDDNLFRNFTEFSKDEIDNIEKELEGLNQNKVMKELIKIKSIEIN